MKVALDASVIRSPMSGVHYAVREQAGALLNFLQREEVTLYSHDPILADAAGGDSVRRGFLPGLCRRPSFRILWQQLVLPHLLRRSEIDVLHALAYTAPAVSRVPSVLNLHDLIGLEHPAWCARLNALQMRMLLPVSIRRAAAIIVSSSHVADRTVELLGISRSRIHRIPLGVDASRFAWWRQPENAADAARDLTAEFALDPHRYLLFVGNIEPKKGLDTLVDAYARLSRELDWDLVIAGRPAWKCTRLLRACRQYEGPGRILLTGRVSDRQRDLLLSQAGAFVFPSRTEGFGLPILEAMAAGVPVVHSDHPVVLETAGNAGLSFRRDAPETLVAALQRLTVSSTLREACIERGIARAAMFPWSKWGESAAAVLRNVAATGSA